MDFRTRIVFQEISTAALFEVRFPRMDVNQAETALRSAIRDLAADTATLHLVRASDHVVGLVKLARWARRRSAQEVLVEIESRLKAFFDQPPQSESRVLQEAVA